MQPTRPCDYSTRKKKGTVEKEKHTSPAIPSVFFFHFSFFPNGVRWTCLALGSDRLDIGLNSGLYLCKGRLYCRDFCDDRVSDFCWC